MSAADFDNRMRDLMVGIQMAKRVQSVPRVKVYRSPLILHHDGMQWAEERAHTTVDRWRTWVAEDGMRLKVNFGFTHMGKPRRVYVGPEKACTGWLG